MKPRQVAFNMLQLIFIINIINPKTLFLFGHTATTRHWRSDFTSNVNSYCSCSSGHIITQLPKCEDFLFSLSLTLNWISLVCGSNRTRRDRPRVVSSCFTPFWKPRSSLEQRSDRWTRAERRRCSCDCEELSVVVGSSAPFRQKLPLFRSLLAHAGGGTERLQDGSRWGHVFICDSIWNVRDINMYK